MQDGRIVEMYRAGEPIEAIMRDTGSAKTSVYRALRRNKVPLRKVDETRIIQLYREGMAVAAIASTTKSSWTTIYRVLDRNNVLRRKGLDADRQERIVEMYTAGATVPEIERQVGCGKSSIRRVLRRAEVPLRRPPKARPAPLAARGEEMSAAYESGESLEEIAGRVGASHAAVRNVLLRRGVKLRPAGGRRPRVFKPDELDRIRELRQGGMSIFDISTEMRADTRPVRDALMDMGLAARPRKTRVNASGGYIYVRDARGEYVLEHRHVMAQALGRLLDRTETVHHIDGDVTNNALHNLQLRQGKHGKGVAMECLDCGSHNVRPAPLRSP